MKNVTKWFNIRSKSIKDEVPVIRSQMVNFAAKDVRFEEKEYELKVLKLMNLKMVEQA